MLMEQGDRLHKLSVRVSDQELEKVQERMNSIGIDSLSAYLRKMAIDGYILKLDMPEIKEMISLLRYSSNNLNQVAKKANSTGSIYGADIAAMQARQDEIWETAKEILARIATIQ